MTRRQSFNGGLVLEPRLQWKWVMWELQLSGQNKLNFVGMIPGDIVCTEFVVHTDTKTLVGVDSMPITVSSMFDAKELIGGSCVGIECNPQESSILF